MVWIFAHRFHAEFSVARLLAPFLLAAPSYDVQLLLATQVADEHRHLQAVLRIYEEVFGVRGGIDAVREVADRNMDLVAEAPVRAARALRRHALRRPRARTSSSLRSSSTTCSPRA